MSDGRPPPPVVVVVGNPKPRSRTLAAARRCGERFAGRLGTEVLGVDLVELGPGLIEPGDERVLQVVGAMRASPLTVVASPVYKATYTGILKLLFDQVGAGDMEGTLGVPMMVAAAPGHALALDVHLRPLLVEVGFACPGPGAFVLEADLAEPGRLDAALDGLVRRWERWLPDSPAAHRSLETKPRVSKEGR